MEGTMVTKPSPSSRRRASRKGMLAHPELGREHLLAKLGPSLQRAGKVSACRSSSAAASATVLRSEDAPACENHDFPLRLSPSPSWHGEVSESG